MAKLVKINTEMGTILVESAVSESTGKIEQAGGINDKVTKKFDELMKVIHPITETIVNSVDHLGKRPQSLSAEFGLSITAEGNIFVVKASGEASLKVTFNWSYDKNGTVG
jgi:hypothetical protein